jgi:hypothetical protein
MWFRSLSRGEVPIRWKGYCTLRRKSFAGWCLCLLSAVAYAQKLPVKNGPDAALKEFRLDDLRADLGAMKDGQEQDYFAGMLANRLNHFSESTDHLSRALPSLRDSRPDRAAIALQALADNYGKTFQYAEAAKADDDLVEHFAGQLSRVELQGIKDDAGVAHILSNAPAQTITWDGVVRLKTKRDPLGDVDADLTVNGVQSPWLLDTGANISVVSATFAKTLGLTLLPGIAQTQAGLTGIENPMRIAILPTLPLGGATLHNVVLLVLDDANLNIGLGKTKYQINAILGYPVFQSLGTITFLHSGEFVAGDPQFENRPGTHMYLKGLTPVIDCRVAGADLPFTFDTGASGSVLFARYYDRFHPQSSDWIKATNKSFGAGGLVKRTVYLQPTVKLGVGDRTATLRKITVYMDGTGTGLDDFYGNLGQDMVANFDSFTLNFRTMAFSLGEPWLMTRARPSVADKAK